MPAPARLHVTLLTPDGDADARAELELAYPDVDRVASDSSRWSRDAQGFSTSAPPGEYKLCVSGGELAPWCETVHVAAPETSLTVRREPGIETSLRFLLPWPAAAESIQHIDLRVEVWDARGQRINRQSVFMSRGGTDRDRLGAPSPPLPFRLAPGTYRVRAERVGRGGRTVEGELVVPSPPGAEPLLLDLR